MSVKRLIAPSERESVTSQAALNTPKSRSRNLLDMAMLFVGKTGAILVGIFFLPIYHTQLGNDAFGVVAIILSIQAFALMADFGMVTLVGRDVASQEPHSVEGFVVWRQAEAMLCAAYGVILVFTLIACALTRSSLDQAQMYTLCVVFFLLIVLQNLAQTPLLAQKHFALASTIQVCGVTFRAGATALALVATQGGVFVFLWVQLISTALHLIITRHFCRSLLLERTSSEAAALTWGNIWRLLRRGSPIFLSGLAGAAVMQLDKPLLSAFVPLGDISPYFLAMSAAVLPTALLAAPLVQYFQPQIIKTIALPRNENSDQIVARFTFALILVVAVPSWILWQWADPIIRLWLRDPGQAALVAGYLRILLPGFALGGLCYVPVVLLLAVQDFKYQALTSVAMTVGTLALVVTFAFLRRVDLVCYSYIAYFVSASISVWWRSFKLPTTRQIAKVSASKSLLPLSALALAATTISFQF